MNYSRKYLRHIKINFDYRDYLEQNHHTLYTNSAEIRICCPFCNESDHKFYFNTDTNRFICFKCDVSNKSADLFNIVAVTENITLREAITKIANQFREITPKDIPLFEGDAIEEVSAPSFMSIKTLDSMPEDSVKIKEESEEALPFLNYLYDRGYSLQDVLDCSIHYVPKEQSLVYKDGKIVGNIGKRILWPIYGGVGTLVAWTARSIDPNLPKKTPKYIHTPGSELSKTVWPFVPPLNKDIIICEGIVDAFALRKAGFSAYTLFGKKVSKEQISLFKFWNVENITVFLDANAKREMLSSVNKLKLQFNNIYVVDVSWWPKDAKGEAKDSGSMLAYPGGLDILQKSINNKINVKNELDYLRWEIQQ